MVNPPRHTPRCPGRAPEDEGIWALATFIVLSTAGAVYLLLSSGQI